jgi:hypothetical protein
MLYELYTREKMRELASEARARLPGRVPEPRSPLGSALVRAAGKLLRRLGAGLEDWGDAANGGPACCETCG